MHNHIHMSSVAFQHTLRNGNRRLNEPMVIFQPVHEGSQSRSMGTGRPSWWNFLLTLVTK